MGLFSGIIGYPKELKELYGYLGLKDNNENKDIEKKEKGEKYQVIMDFDDDGKTVKVEAQYHLLRLNIDDVSKEKKEKLVAMQKKFALTKDDKVDLAKVFKKRLLKERKIEDPAFKTAAIVESLFLIRGVKFAKKEKRMLLKEALKTASKVEGLGFRVIAVQSVYNAMADAGLSEKEMKTITQELEAEKP